MLAEIFMLRLETMVRASEKPVEAKNSRYVPLPMGNAPDLGKAGRALTTL